MSSESDAKKRTPSPSRLSAPSSSGRTNPTPPAGASRLIRFYEIIGTELLRLEAEGRIGDFREGVTTVPVEVLESYLEDLLDSSQRDERLYIKLQISLLRSVIIPGLGVIAGVIVGLYASSLGISIVFSFGITALVAFPCAIMMRIHPRLGLIRRMSFAQALSSEIARRRGRNISGDAPTTPLLLAEVLRPSRTLQGAARRIIQ